MAREPASNAKTLVVSHMLKQVYLRVSDRANATQTDSVFSTALRTRFEAVFFDAIVP